MDQPLIANSLIWLGVSTVGIIFFGIVFELAKDGISGCFSMIGLGGSALVAFLSLIQLAFYCGPIGTIIAISIIAVPAGLIGYFINRANGSSQSPRSS